jgi:hypothetical protein
MEKYEANPLDFLVVENSIGKEQEKHIGQHI